MSFPINNVAPGQEASFPVERNSSWMNRSRMIDLKKIAVPVIGLLALSALPTVDGGPVGWAACIVACEAAAVAATAVTAGGASPALIACTTACWAVFAAPTP